MRTLASSLQHLLMGHTEEEETSRENSMPRLEELARAIIIKALTKIQSAEGSLPLTGQAASIALSEFQENEGENLKIR